MSFTNDVEYRLKLNLHCKLMLAFRYGIAIEKDTVLAYFVGKLPTSHEADLTTRDYCKFKIEGKTVNTVIEGNVVVTARPKGIFQDRDPIAISHMFDSALSVSPRLYTMQEIVDWRERYLEKNGSITKDDFRRELKKRAPNQRSSEEILGLHDSFFEEVKELRFLAEMEALRILMEDPDRDFTKGLVDTKASREADRLRGLAKTEQTIMYIESPEYAAVQEKEAEDWLSSDEYKKEMQLDWDELRREILSVSEIKSELELKRELQPVFGAPFGGEKQTSHNNNTIFYHKDYIITGMFKDVRNDGWHEIHYRNATKRFITVTKQDFIFNSYKLGQKGVWTILYKNGNRHYMQLCNESSDHLNDE